LVRASFIQTINNKIIKAMRDSLVILIIQIDLEQNNGKYGG